MNTDAFDELRHALETQLTVEPPPGFVSRLRSGIERAQRRPQSWRRIELGLAVAALLLVALYVGRTSFWSATPTRTTTRSALRGPDSSAGRTELRSADPAQTTNRSALRTPSAAVGRTELRSAGPARTTTRSARRAPDDQQQALIRLLAALREGRATVPATVAPAFDADGALVAPAPVVIAPLTIDSLPIPDPEGERERDRR